MKEIESAILKIIEQLIKFPYPQICRHSIALSLLSLLEEQSTLDLPDKLAKAIVKAEDEKALSILENFQFEH